MLWLHTLDVSVFRFINGTLSNSFFDVVMPFASGNRYFFPVLAVIGMLLLWKGGKRGWLCALMAVLILGPGDSYVYNTLKHAVARPRPFVTLTDVNLPMSRNKNRPTQPPAMDNPQKGAPVNLPNYNSMPSSHAANWFAATMICLVFYRRSWRFMLPMACLVSFSRIYNGVHYPSDVLAGAIVGAGYAAAALWAIESLWRLIGARWFPLWFQQLPSLVNIPPSTKGTTVTEEEELPPLPDETRPAKMDAQWLHLGYLFIAFSLLVNLAYLASGLVELSEDEAYQWVWSKHLALSYYSKPLLIACIQWLGTHIWGDTTFGVRFFAPVISAILGVMLLRFFAREVNARAGFFLALIVSATPLLALGSVIMTIDPPLVLFWTAAMISGWQAVKSGNTSTWLWTGLWMGLGFLSKYMELAQLACWIIFFILWKPARAQLRKPGPYLALLVNLLCFTPVVIWNQQHHWVTISHVGANAGTDKTWVPSWSHLSDFGTFMGVEAFLLNPIFFVAALWASIAFWRRGRHDPRMVFLFSMGTPLFLGIMLWSFHSAIKPNWIAPSVLPMMCLALVYWDTRWRLGVRALKGWLIAGLSIGFVVVVFMHEPDLIQHFAGRPLPPKIDPATRVRGYRAMAATVEAQREQLLADGKPVFLIGAHYSTTGHLSFYIPEAHIDIASHPLVYCQTSIEAKNQFYFWPGYKGNRTGDNAIYVKELRMPKLKKNWPSLWLRGTPLEDLPREEEKDTPAPQFLTQEFETVKDLGVFPIYYKGRIFHYIQLFECRNLH